MARRSIARRAGSHRRPGSGPPRRLPPRPGDSRRAPPPSRRGVPVSGHEEEIVASRTQLLRELPSDAGGRAGHDREATAHRWSPLRAAASSPEARLPGRWSEAGAPPPGARPRSCRRRTEPGPAAAFPEEAGARHRCHAYLAREPHRERGVVGGGPPGPRERGEVGEDVVGALRRLAAEPRVDQRVLQQVAARPVTRGESAVEVGARAPRARPPRLPGAAPARRR